ncbi:MAG: 4-hydroxy-tetrahydrodipicolinate reductase [Flavobacteriales bacterium]|nr:4-hydroxy-tetrahydrodipicolinate reductase [Flavobacteriales bacterium]
MKIALIGYGKMGKAIEKIALEQGHELVLKISSRNKQDLTVDALKKADVAIEFTVPELATKHIQMCFKAQVPVAVGTTGWYKDLDLVEQLRQQHNGTLLTASNFSIGVNIFFEINERLAALMAKRKDYSALIQETHHIEKLDSPSGTAITLADGIIKQHAHYNNWKNEAKETDNDLEILSFREPNVPGTHEIIFDSNIDQISIKHEAKNRKGFALGAVLAAEFIHDKKGIFTMKDVLKN